MIVYLDNRKPTLKYNFDASKPLKAEAKHRQRMAGKAKHHRVSKDILTGTIRALDMPVMNCISAHS